ncbi:nitrile hydratase accessory protein [Aquibaculum arenosum]|uniref:Nitrile hydratase accessory protein n=1 Tax=Aquibaculum arenosum TaxID=3032591 RepID=A0ABT5YNK2_9PROT|nr:nitrile hydratase accessory protein [Fodinicurvata sp. CAU 1616]MDF2096529.1 nitrile hydratase accessory protein [Fodinicurvata sp. CAU 1616]
MKPPEPKVFAEPWQAQAFAITVRLNETGRFTWSEWAEVFGAELRNRRAAGAEDSEGGYWEAWLKALEVLLTDRRLAESPDLDRLEQAWAEAYRTTPHGQPVRLADRG